MYKTTPLSVLAEEVIGQLERIASSARKCLSSWDCQALSSEPAIARLRVNKEGKRIIYYFCRAESHIDFDGIENLVRYKAPIGRLASLPLGKHTIPLPAGPRASFGEKDVVFEILEKAILTPEEVPAGWDSCPTNVYEPERGDTPIRIESLRKLLEQPVIPLAPITAKTPRTPIMVDKPDNKKPSTPILTDDNISVGLKRTVIKKMELRDQPILDPYQDGIFRLPIDKRLMILGPPGTGKTTTLIRRLGQKINTIDLTPGEQELVDRIGTKQKHPHSKNWLMFTPQELLKHYLKEAFAREGVPAPDTNVQTWENYRRVLGRDIFKVLQNARVKGNGFILKEDIQNIRDESFAKTIEWYEDFDAWQRKEYAVKLFASAEQLLDTIDFPRIHDEIRKAVAAVDEELRYTRDAKLLNKLFERKDSLEEQSRTTSSLQSRLNTLKKYWGKLAPTSLIVEAIEIKNLLTGIDKFTTIMRIPIPTIIDRPINYYLEEILGYYRAFRLQRQNESKWYWLQGENSRDIHPLELDVILLVILRAINYTVDLAGNDIDNSAKGWSVLKPYIDIFRNQVLVDEATDFSPVQLACMAALAHPRLKSFFACGDFNQRVTSWGTRSDKELKWIFPDFDTREITIAYRQSQQLNDFAKAIIRVVNGAQTKVILPDRVQNEGVKPALLEHVTGEAVVTWLAERIYEIERFVDQQLPSTAIFVNSEDEVGPVTTALNSLLAEYNLKVTACHNGQILGQGNDIRVFDIQHIKGLEFEAVFFVGLDRLALQLPDLFDKYLYVGATRAATYLGITCERTLPSPIDNLREHFGTDWTIDTV